MLNDVELRELSLTEADVNREANKPFSESISLTGRRPHLPWQKLKLTISRRR